MGTFGDILREQAPEIVSDSQNRMRNNILTSFPDIPEELLFEGKTENLIEWFLHNSISKVEQQDQDFDVMREDAQSRLIFGMNIEVFLLLGNIQHKLRETLKTLVITAYDIVTDFDSTINSEEVRQLWAENRSKLKSILNRKIQNHEFPRKSKETSIYRNLKSKNIDTSELSLEDLSDDVIRELAVFLSDTEFLTRRIFLNNKDKEKSRWSVFKFGKTTGFRMIMIDNTIIGVLSHLEYETNFLETFYNGFSFPPQLLQRYKSLISSHNS